VAANGFGEHFWNLEPGQLLHNLRLCEFTLSRLSRLHAECVLVYIASSIYTISLGLIKVSLCMFYLKIFPAPRIRMVCWIIVTWIVLNTLIIFFLTVFSCLPVQAFWDRDVPGKCLDIRALAYANSASAIAQDLALVIFPLVCIEKLNMNRYRKFAVGLMFCIGTLYVYPFYGTDISNIRSGCITTMVRFQILLSFGTSIDPTWDYVPVTKWTELELACGFVCASLPAVRIFFVTITPKALLSSSTSKSNPRSRGAPTTPGPDPSDAQKPDRNTLSWLHLSPKKETASSLNKTQYRPTGLWQGTPPRYKSKARGHKRLSSLFGQYREFDMSHVRTCTPPVPRDAASEHVDQVLGPQAMPASRLKVHDLQSFGSEGVAISALPRIGCLPDEGYLKDEEGECEVEEVRWWEEVRRSIETAKRAVAKNEEAV
jgi:hypothetical protein